MPDGSSNNISFAQMQDLLAEFNGMFGYQEKISAGALDTANTWTEVTANGGAVSIGNSGSIKFITGAVAAAICAEEAKAALPIHSGVVGSSKMFGKFIMECVAQFDAATPSNIDNTTFLIGLVKTSGATRATNDIVGFGLASDALTAISDASGSEETNDVSASATLTDWNKLKLEYNGSNYKFYINDNLVATHSTRVPAVTFPAIYVKNDGAASQEVYFRAIRWWFEK